VTGVYYKNMYFNIKAAEYLRSSYRAVQRYLADGRIPYTKPAGKILINEQDLVDFVQMKRR
jgi:excisionase family DNA binding protein